MRTEIERRILKSWMREFEELTISSSQDLFIHFSGHVILFAKTKYNDFWGKNPDGITLGIEVEVFYSLTPVF